MLKDLIDSLPNDDAYMKLIDMFDKLLKKYAKLLSFDDAYEELRLFFIELVLQIKNRGIHTSNDGYIVSYISKSVRNQYIALSKKQRITKENMFSEISEEQLFYVEELAATTDSEDISDYFPQNTPLTSREKTILRKIFVEEYSVEEVAQILGISRQAVNQAKRRALTKIRNSITDNSSN